MRIGLDLDHTIISYNDSYKYILETLKIETECLTKAEIKKFFEKPNRSGVSWLDFQQCLYTLGLKKALPQPGVLDILSKARHLEHELFIVSHKTNTHFPLNDKLLNLREEAMRWLLITRIYPELVNKEDIYFVNDGTEKLTKIKDLSLDVFIDDLPEIIFSRDFPARTIGYLFGSRNNKNEMVDFAFLERHLK
jgi:hypothetical protein